MSGWRLLTAVTAIILGVGLGVAGSLADDADHQVSLTVFVDPSVAQASTNSSDPAAERAALDTYIATAQSTSVLRSAAAAGGISVDALRDGLSVAGIGSSNAVIIQFRSAGPVKKTTVETVGAEALNTYASAGLSQLRKTVAINQNNYDKSTDALTRYLRSTGEVSPDIRYQAIISAAAAGQQPSAATRATLRRLQGIVPKYRNLTAEQTRAGNLLQDAQGRLLDLQATLQQSESADSLTAGPVVAISKFARALRYGFAGGLAGFIVAASVLAIAVILTRPGRNGVAEGWARRSAPGQRISEGKRVSS